MAAELSPFEREARETVLKSSFTGVAATAIAIVAFSPSGFGDWIGASVASSFGLDSSVNAAENPYASLPAYPAPMTEGELSAIRGQLVSSAASLALLRAATDDRIEYVRTLALNDGLVTFTPTRHAVLVAQPDLRLSLSEPASFEAPMPEAPVEAYVIASAPVEATIAPVSYSGGGFDASVPNRDPHLELADLLLAHEAL